MAAPAAPPPRTLGAQVLEQAMSVTVEPRHTLTWPEEGALTTTSLW